MNTALPYGSPAALRAALTERLKRLAAASPFTVTELYRQFAYDRLLTRVFASDDELRWILKGATALLARLDVARHSKDIDLACQSTGDPDEAEAAFRTAVGRDAGDFFLFDVGPATPLVGDKGRRFAVVAILGGRPFATFSVDIVTAESMTGRPDPVPPLVQLGIPGLPTVEYRAYPLVDHIADKITACIERHAHNGVLSVSTRYKDMVDLVLLARSQRPHADELRRAIRYQTAFRGIDLPAEFSSPGPLWPAGYEAKAAEVTDLGVLGRFDRALTLVKRFLDPVLNGTAVGEWDPARSTWTGVDD
jgi:hypothetical protein